MRKSPVSRTAFSKIALAAFAATTFSNAIGLGAVAQERSQQIQRQPVQITPSAVESLRMKPLKPSRPTRENRLQVRRDADPAPRKLTAAPSAGGPDTPSQLANLVVIPFFSNGVGLPEGFPEHSYCAKNPAGGTPNQIKFWVRNAGGSDSGSFQWTPSFPTAGAAPAQVIANVPAYGQVLVTQGLPNGCYDGNFSALCQFSIHLDDHDEVEEWSEANTYESYCVSPAG